MKEVKVFEDKVLAAYKNAKQEGKQLLSDIFGCDLFQPKDITDRIKTMRDVCEACGKDYDVEFAHDRIKWLTADEVAYKELKLISEALNEGDVLTLFNKSQYKYYPYVTVSGCGLSLYGVYYVDTYSYVAPHLCYKSEKLVRYAFAQFPESFKNYFLKNKQN